MLRERGPSMPINLDNLDGNLFSVSLGHASLPVLVAHSRAEQGEVRRGDEAAKPSKAYQGTSPIMTDDLRCDDLVTLQELLSPHPILVHTGHL